MAVALPIVIQKTYHIRDSKKFQINSDVCGVCERLGAAPVK